MQYFHLFALPATFALDAKALDAAYRAQQSQSHPDKFAATSDTDRRAAQQRSALLNDAYKTLKDPVTRAAYLIKNRYSDDPFDERNTKMPAAFLVEQMELREALAELRADGARERDVALEALLDRVHTQAQGAHATLQRVIDEAPDKNAAIEHTRKLRFLQKVASEIEDALA